MQLLSDVTVIDLSLKLPGPYATKLLSELGAEVLSVEPPGGDYLGDPDSEEYRAAYRALNEGKESYCIDLKDDRGQEFVQDLASAADVVVEGFAPGTAERLGVDVETLRGRNEDLVYCSLSGYGQTGPRSDEPGHDLNYQAVAGTLHPADPRPPTTPIADYGGALVLVVAVLAALWGRDRGSGGQYLDVAMFDVLASWNSVHHPWVAAGDDEPDYDPVIGGDYPCYNTYEAADGRWLAVGTMERRFWVDLCERLDRPDLVDRQFATGGRESQAYQELQSEFRRKSREAWLDELGEELPISPVQTTGEAVEDPQSLARSSITQQTADGERAPESFGFPVAMDGETNQHQEHTLTDTLRQVGYDDEELASLAADSVVVERTE